jgi:hypothetical protein
MKTTEKADSAAAAGAFGFNTMFSMPIDQSSYSQ